MPSFEMNNLFSKTVKKEVDNFLNKAFFFCKSNNYSEEIVLSAASNSYVETVEGKADSLHLKIKQCEWENILVIKRI